ncbi:MAG: dihydroorotase [Bacilli bacterium]|nr:dihydroorotase [Bacilli bacterium]
MKAVKANIILPKLIKQNVLKFLKRYPQYNQTKYTFIPSFMDVHVHFREPGFVYKESIKTGSLAAARGGYTLVATMPNLNPVSDTPTHLKKQLSIIKKDSVIEVVPYGAISLNEEGKRLSPLEKTAPLVMAFSDDGKGVESEALMKEAMKKAKKLHKVIAAHCEVKALTKGGYIHDGVYAKKHHHVGIPSSSEYEEVKRDIKLAKLTGCAFHVCHVSSKESVDLIRKAKKAGVNITAETAPHYLLLNDAMLKEDGMYKINPPIRSKADQLALIKGIKDGTIDMIATDHAPHALKEKNRGLKNSLFGASGLEIAFPLLYTYLVKKKVISLDKLMELLVINPRKRFNYQHNGDFSVWNLNETTTINPSKFLSKGKNTPFKGYKVSGVNYLTLHKQKVVYRGKKI